MKKDAKHIVYIFAKKLLKYRQYIYVTFPVVHYVRGNLHNVKTMHIFLVFWITKNIVYFCTYSSDKNHCIFYDRKNTPQHFLESWYLQFCFWKISDFKSIQTQLHYIRKYKFKFVTYNNNLQCNYFSSIFKFQNFSKFLIFRNFFISWSWELHFFQDKKVYRQKKLQKTLQYENICVFLSVLQNMKPNSWQKSFWHKILKKIVFSWKNSPFMFQLPFSPQ